ncbi:MAG: DUF2974 domain-containing protein [Spirochaetia bacterium]|nr:DUF2974 domain-containing protein [Spirochaetia bacterium]
MDNLYDYLYWRGDLSFDTVAPNEIDMVIFAVLSYVDYSSVLPLGKVTEGYMLPVLVEKMDSAGALKPKKGTPDFEVECLSLLPLLASKPRFSKTRVFAYSCHLDKDNALQFAAVSFLLETGSLVVSYRGTDASLIGWKEDFLMSFKVAVGCQELGFAYLKEVASKTSGQVYTVGHSKGGNVASYAAMKADAGLQKRIKGIYSFDGPGFNEQTLSTLRCSQVCDRITTLVPQGSVVGILMQHEEPIQVVYSAKKSGIMQHFPFSWEVEVNHFKRMEERDRSSLVFDTGMRKWLEGLSKNEMQLFVDSVFACVDEAGANRFRDVVTKPGKTLSSMLKVYSLTDPESRKQLEKVLRSFFASMASASSDQYQTKREALLDTLRKSRKVRSGISFVENKIGKI